MTRYSHVRKIDGNKLQLHIPGAKKDMVLYAKDPKKC